MPFRLGRGPLLVALMAGAELGAVEELLEYGENPGQVRKFRDPAVLQYNKGDVE